MITQTMHIKAKTKSIICITCLTLIAIVTAKKWHDYHREHQQQLLVASRPAVTLHSSRPYHEVRIPFRRDSGHIELVAYSSGRTFVCIFDTGDVITQWPRSFALVSMDAHLHYSQFTPFSPMQPRPADWRTLSDLNLGNYELQNCAGIAYNADESDSKQFPLPLLIGYQAMAQVVLTIDYHKQELVFRDQSYDVTRLAAGPQIYLMNMVSNPEEPNEPIRQPLIAGTIAGYPVHLILDTGLAAGGVALANPKLISTIQKTIGGKPLFNRTMGGRALPDTTWSLGSLVDQSPIDVMPDFVGDGVDGVLGYAILQNYRITIDYGRHKVLLEWNPLREDAQIHIQSRKAGVFHSPRDPFVHIELGKAYLFADEYHNAKQEFTRAISLDSSSAFAHFKLGQCFYYLGEYTEANREFEHASKLKPADALTFLWQGMAWSREGKRTAALKAWQTAIALDKTTYIAQDAEKLIKKHF